MARRRLTVKRIDPWSVLKFAVIVNLALLAVGLLVAYIVWMIVERLELVDQACSIALDVGFTACGVNAGNLFRALILLGLLWVVVQTAIMVFFAFLHNLIADLTGGLVFGVIDDTPAARARTTAPAVRETAHRTGEFDRPRTPDRRDAGRTSDRRDSGRTTAVAGRPPVAPLGRDEADPGAWTDGFVVDEGADPVATDKRDDDLWAPDKRDDELFGRG